LLINNNKNRMVEVAFLLSVKHGFDNVSIKQIQEEANVSAGAIYYHFKDKNDILVCMVNRYIKDEINVFKKNLNDYEGSLFEKLRFILCHYTGEMIDNEDYSIALSNNDRIDHLEYNLFLLGIYHQHPELRPIFHEINKEMLDIYKEFVEELKDSNQIRKDVDTEEVAIYISTTAAGFVKLWTGFPDIPLGKFVDSNVKMICNSIGA